MRHLLKELSAAVSRFLNVLFAAIVTDVSVIPQANFPSVLPVQGAIISASSRHLGPIGSASFIVNMHLYPLSLSNVPIKSSALPKRVSVVLTISDTIGNTSYPSDFKTVTSAMAFCRVQKEPQTAKPIFFALHY